MFMKFSRLRLSADLFGGKEAKTDISFDDGCTVVLTNSNTQGKSSLINALAVGLGFDELVKSNVSALVNDTIKYKNAECKTLGAEIYLEIKNDKDEFLSIKRSIKPDFSKGMLVKRSPLSEWNEEEAEEFYIGKDSYQGTKGFHRLLSEFIGFPDIEVISQNDGIMKLYLEYIFAAIFIEQKRGWADIMTNTPYFQVRDPRKTTISEILGMDYIKDNLQRSSLKLEVGRLKTTYEDRRTLLSQYVNNKHFLLKSIPSDISSNLWNPEVFQSFEGQKNSSLKQLINDKKNTLSAKGEMPKGVSASPELEIKITEISKKITSLVSNKDEVDRTLASLDGAIKNYNKRMEVLTSDLDKNKEEQKIRKLFSHDSWSTKDHCPVCEQGINESLLSQVKRFPTMSLDDNVKYISEQKKLLEEVLSIELERRKNAEVESKHISAEIKSLITQHSDIQKSLSGVIPSEMMAHAREIASLEQGIIVLTDLDEYTQNVFGKLKDTFDSYHVKSKRLNALKSDLSSGDKTLIRKFEAIFKSYLKQLGYVSFDVDSVVIDKTTLFPRILIDNMDKIKRIRADSGSSASDSIRMVTAYTLALHACKTNSPKSKHPNVSIFDEPAQQNMDIEDHLKFFDIVSDVCNNGGQVIVAATDKDHSVKKKAESLNMTVVDFGESFVLG